MCIIYMSHQDLIPIPSYKKPIVYLSREPHIIYTYREY